MKNISRLTTYTFLLTFLYSTSHAIDDVRLDKLYNPDEPRPLWMTNGQWTSCAEAMLAQLYAVSEEGLDPEDYRPLLEKLASLDLSDPLQRLEADRVMTVAALDYISDMKGERLNPRRIDRQLYYRQVDIDETQLLTDFMVQDGLSCQWLTQLAPQRKDYRDLKSLLAQYRSYQALGGWPSLSTKVRLKLGDAGDEVQNLRNVLVTQGYLTPTYEHGVDFDSVVEEAVKEYQRYHGLDADGVVGPATAKSMNMTLEERIQRILVAMERQRWLPEDMGDRYVQVNIAGFELKAVENDRVKFKIPVITGKHYRETPNYSTEMVGVRFNPPWNVPYNIAVQDKLPKLQNNPYAFSGKGYSYYDSYGNNVDPGSIDWSSYGRGHFPFHIRQSPGAGNALGKIRFTLSNKEHGLAIFLHGTPSKNLWTKARRSFSSGCIRVEDPPKLAEFVLNSPAWTPERIEREASGTVTKNVPLTPSVKTHITYFTVWIDEEGKTHFVEDVYGQDKQIWNALQQHKRSYKTL